MDTSASDILDRLAIEKINKEVIWGREDRGEPDPHSYDQRLTEARQRIVARITDAADHPGEDAKEAAIQEVQALLDTAKDVYTNVGVKVGADLADQNIRRERRKIDRAGSAAPVAAPIAREKAEAGVKAEEEDFRPLPGEAGKAAYSSNLFEQMRSRVSLQAVGDYIRYDRSAATLCQKPFQERMDEAGQELEQKIHALIQDRKAAAKMRDAVTAYEGTVSDVYFALGMKAGAQLNDILMGGFDKDY